MTSLVEVQNLSLRFEFTERDILSELSFSLEQGESIMILGPSGCGKSTLTLCLNGLYPRELDGTMSGEIMINGKPTTSYKPGQLSRFVGVVFQDPETQFCMLTVEDEVAFGLENISVPREEIEERIDHALHLVNMENFKQSTISTLSGGQKQKIALACILAMKPSLLILDEPTANLDPIARMDLIQTIKQLKKEIGFSLIIIEHQLDEWTELADRCLLFNKKGSVFYDGSLRHAILSQRKEIEEEGIWLPKVVQQLLPYAGPDSSVIPLTLEEFSHEAHLWSNAQWEGNAEKNERETQDVFMECNDVSFIVNGQDILKNISITVGEQEFVAIVGANGSGKTTLSRILSGLQRPTNGTVLLHDKALHNWSETELRKEIGYVFQNPEHQFIMNSVYDEIAFSLQMKGIREIEIQQRVGRILEHFGLTDYSNEHPYALSQGQKRRLSIGAMIVDEQKMLILDEPTFGQDASTNEEMMRMLDARYRTGTGIVMITHDMDLAHTYAERIIVLYKGMVVADCTPAELWQQPIEVLQEWGIDLPIQVKIQRLCEKEDHDYVLAST
ncbi:ABC transporter ATP-binding protein [Lysinibacillus yapensis]|uniref:ABC transporter ATP-binding protein n=1 Tax=Ureibacillus yapensis TaxID=2304605 RepID=A0A396S770_9BACL|nr:ABC transporter ATP-binding protein [Lysinibacillus yapensis]RHW36701.1 ABC transporter ATP-binding protein [Lysinibacillus yapensis]